MNTHRLRSAADYVLHTIGRFPRNGVHIRYLRMVLIFVLSGAFHSVIDISAGISKDSWSIK
jgi:hypothetical protein